MNKKEFREILDFLFGNIPNINIDKLLYDDYNYEENIEIINNFLNNEEDSIKNSIPEYNINDLNNSKFIENINSKICKAEIIFKEIDSSLFYHNMLLNKEVISKIIYHKILKTDRRYKIDNILS